MIKMLTCADMLCADVQLIDLSLVIFFPIKSFFFFFGLVRKYLSMLTTWPHRYGLTVTLFSLHFFPLLFQSTLPHAQEYTNTHTHDRARTRIANNPIGLFV